MHDLPLTLRPASGVPFYRQVDGIGDLIRDSSTPARACPRLSLATHRGVLITIRRAYADLEQAGLLVRRQGQGTFVAQNVGTPPAVAHTPMRPRGSSGLSTEPALWDSKTTRFAPWSTRPSHPPPPLPPEVRCLSAPSHPR